MYTKEYLLSLNYFVQNEYFNQYYELLESNKNTMFEKCKTNSHHIIPRHYFQDNNISIDNTLENKVNLRYCDHLLAHMLMSCCTEGQNRWKNLYSVFYMSGQKYVTENDIEYVKNKLDNYQEIYERAIAAAPNHWKGKHRSEETKKKMSAAKKGTPSSVVGKVWVNNGCINKAIEETEVDMFLSNGWSRGRHIVLNEEAKRKMDEARRKPRSEEFCKKMHDIASKQGPMSEEIRLKLSNYMVEYYKTHDAPFKGRKHTEESKQKMRESLSTKVTINNGFKTVRVMEKNLDKYISDGWCMGAIEHVSNTKSVWMHRGDIRKKVPRQSIEEYTNAGFILGMK